MPSVAPTPVPTITVRLMSLNLKLYLFLIFLLHRAVSFIFSNAAHYEERRLHEQTANRAHRPAREVYLPSKIWEDASADDETTYKTRRHERHHVDR